MQKIYEKSELWFAIIWIIIYVIGTSIAENISRNLCLEKSVTLVFHIALCILLVIWMGKNKLFMKFGLCRPKVKSSKYLYYIPLLLIISCNLWFGVTLNFSAAETTLYIGSMVCVGFLEEVIFRGFLFKAMCRDSVKAAVIVSSVTFGIGHIINLFNGSGADLLSNICQICYAVAAGFMFVIIFYRGGSLWPCIITHSTVNALSVFADESGQTAAMEIISALALTAIALVYTIVLTKTLPMCGSNVEDKNIYGEAK